jgi:hypothetical protein
MIDNNINKNININKNKDKDKNRNKKTKKLEIFNQIKDDNLNSNKQIKDFSPIEELNNNNETNNNNINNKITEDKNILKEKKQEKTKEEKFKNLNQRSKYKRFKIFLRDFLHKEEKKFMENLTEKQKIHIEKKLKNIKDLLNNSKNLNTNKLPENFIEKLKEFSYNDYGFIKNEERLKILKILFLIEEDQPKEKLKKSISYIQSINKKGDLYIKKFKEIYSIKEINFEEKEKEKEMNNNKENKDQINLFYNENNNHFYKSNILKDVNYSDNDNDNKNININPYLKYSNIIDLDVRRTIFNSIFFNDEEMDIMLNFLKKQIAIKIKIFFTLFPEYSYYQGFHEIAIYFYILILQDKDIEKDYFNTEENDDIFFYEVLQRISEFYLKDYLTDYDKGFNYDNDNDNDNKMNLSNKNPNTNTSFPTFVFTFENIYKIINDIIKLEDNFIYEFIQEKSDFPDPIYTLPWILTYFTQDIKNINKLFRIFDYLLMEHPLGIYFLSSNVNIILYSFIL